MRDQAKRQENPSDEITVSLIRRGAKSIKANTGTGMDLWSPHDVANTTDEGLEELAEIYTGIEKSCTWPLQTFLNIIGLMGKENGTRPIGLMPMIYRIWSKMRRSDVRLWEDIWAGPWDAAIRGSSGLRAAIMATFVEEVASYNHETIITILWDMEKFYDNRLA